MEHHVNVMSTVEIHSVTVVSWHQKKMKTSTFVDAHTSAVFTHVTAMFQKNELTQAEVVERLAAIGEKLGIKQLLYKIKQSLGAVFLCFLLKNLKLFLYLSGNRVYYM